MTPEKYIDLKEFVISQGYAADIDFYDEDKALSPEIFALEAGWVICNSGMKNQIAEKIWHRVRAAISEDMPIYPNSFGHKLKADSIQYIWDYKEQLFEKYLSTPDEKKMDLLESLPFIGKITKYHLAKNLGMDVCKPDRHLVRIAEKFKTTPEKLCQKLADATGDRIATVDYVIWRAANLGKI